MSFAPDTTLSLQLRHAGLFVYLVWGMHFTRVLPGLWPIRTGFITALSSHSIHDNLFEPAKQEQNRNDRNILVLLTLEIRFHLKQ